MNLTKQRAKEAFLIVSLLANIISFTGILILLMLNAPVQLQAALMVVQLISLALLSIAMQARKQLLDIFSPQVVIAIAYVLIFGVGSINYLIRTPDHVVYPLALSILSLIGILIGCRISFVRERSADYNFTSAVNDAKEYDNKHVYIVVAVIIVIATLATALLVINAGLPFLSENKVTERLVARRQVTSWVIYAIRSSIIAFFILFAFKVTRDRGLRVKHIPTLLAIWLYVAFINIVPGWRGPVLFFALGTVILYHYTCSRISATKGFIVGSLFLVGTIGWGLIRVLTASDEHETVAYLSQIVSSNYELYLIMGSLALSVYMYGLIATVSAVPDVFDYFLGTVYLRTWATALPGEYPTVGAVLKGALQLDFDGVNLNPTIIGEAYIDFGVFGVILYSLLYGYVLGYLYRRRFRSIKNTIIYTFVIMSFIIGIMTGILGQAIYTFNFIVMILALGAIRRKRLYH